MKHDITLYSRAQQGFGLIELMVALALGLILTMGAITFFQDSLQSSRTAISSSNMQAIAQIAIESIKTDVRMAGFRGECVPSDTPATTGSAIVQFYSVMGEEGAGTNSDRLQIYTADIQDAELNLSNFSQADQTLTICSQQDSGCIAPDITSPPGSTDNPADLFLLSDCRNWAVFNLDATANTLVFKPTQSDETQFNPALNMGDYLLPGSNPSTTQVRTLATDAFVLYKVGSSATGGATEYRVVQDSSPESQLSNGDQPFILLRNGEPLAYGVENLQVLYGRMLNGRLVYSAGCTAAELADQQACNTALAGTTHLRVSLVIQSDQRTNAPIGRTFNIANLGANSRYQAPADGRLRRVYTTTIQLRNAL